MYDLVVQMIEKVFGDAASKAVADSVYFDVSSYPDVWKMVSNFYDKFLVPVGVCILVFMFFYALTEKLAVEGITFETAGKMICKLLFFCAFMEFGLQLAMGILDLSNAVLQGMNADNFSAAAADKAVKDIIYALWGVEDPTTQFGGFWGTIYEYISCTIAMLLMLLPWLVTLITEVLIEIVVLTRKIEIFVRATFMPVAIGDSYNGMSSGAVRYIKGFLAVCLQGALIVVIMRLSAALSTEYFNNAAATSKDGLEAAMWLVAVPITFKIAAAGLVLKSLPLAKEICGTN